MICNDCGSNRIETKSISDEDLDEVYYFDKCKDCGSENISKEVKDD